MTAPLETRLLAGVLLSQRYGVAVALFPADELSEIEVQRAPDSAGSPDVGAASTIAVLPPGSRLFVDELPPNAAPFHYRTRATLAGYDPSGWTCWAMGLPAPLPDAVTLPDVVVPTVSVARAVSGITGTVTVTVADPQCRVTQVEFRTKVGAAAYSSWAVDSTVPYEQTVSITPGALSLIGYRVTGYDGRGSLRVLAEGEDTFNADHLVGMLTVVPSFDEDGVLTVRVIGDVQTGSVRVAVSTSAFPSSGTVGAATAVDGRQSAWTFAGPYTLGQAVYISAIGYTGAAGAGTASDKIDALTYRANSTTSKTIRLPGAAVFSSADGTTELGQIASGYYRWTLGSPPFHHGFLPVPKGVTLTAVRARTYCADTGGTTADELYFSLDRLGADGAPTDIGGGDVSSVNDAWETQAITALAEDTSGDRSYNLKLSGLNGTGVGVNPALRSFRCAWVEYDIDVPNVDAST